MSVNIQTPEGLIKISGDKVTTSNIISALGYTPADETHTHDDKYYTESEVDTKIADIDSTILSHTDNTTIHITSDERTAWNAKADLTYVNTELAKKSDSGHTHDQYLEAEDISNKADKSELHEHSNKTVLDGISADDITNWNNKSEFSGDYNDLTNAPNIYEGFETTTLTAQTVVVNGIDVETSLNEAIGKRSTGQYAEIFNTYSGESANVASGDYSHAEGTGTTASGDYSHAEGAGTTALGNSSHAEGESTEASNSSSHAEGYNTTASGYASHAEGMNATASGDYSHVEGIGTTALGEGSHAGGHFTIANKYQYVVGRYNADTTAPTSITDTATSTGLFIVGIGSSDTARSNGFRVSASGKVYGTGVFGTSGADYAEYFEWFDGNPNNEDRRGRFVTLDGGKIRYATSNDDYILGVVSANPSVAGDIQSESWHNMYLKDIYGSKLVEVVEVEETTNENGEIIPAHTESRWVLNPDYNPDVKYISREERPEWAAIGIVGKLVVVDDGTCQVNGYCYPNVDGIVTASQEKTNYRVMERLDDTHIRIFIK